MGNSDIIGSLFVFIGLYLLFSTAIYVSNTTATETDDILVIGTQTILAEVPLLIIEITLPFAGGIGICFTAGGTVTITYGRKKRRIL